MPTSSVPHRIVVSQKDEMRFRMLMRAEGYRVPLTPHVSSPLPNYAFVIEAPPEETFDFLRPDILPPR